MSRPRQCVPLACIKYMCNESPTVPAPLSSPAVCQADTSHGPRQPAPLSSPAVYQADTSHGPRQPTPLSSPAVYQADTSHGPRQPAAAVSTPATQLHTTVSQSVHNSPCSLSVSVTSSSCSTAVSVQYSVSNSVQQSTRLCTMLTATTDVSQYSQCHSSGVSVTSAPTVGLASAVWTPRGAALQPAPQRHAVDNTQLEYHAEQLRLVALHHRLTISFNGEFSQHMNTIIEVIHEASRVLTSSVFQYTLERLRELRFKYCRLSEICNAYGVYQRNIRSNQSERLAAVSCLHSSIQMMMDAINTVTAVFRELHQWLSADSRMTVTERGLGLSNRVCHFAPVFMRELRNFEQSLLMILPDAVSASVAQSASNANIMLNRVSSVVSQVNSSAATTEASTDLVSDTVTSHLQGNETADVHDGQDVQPILIAPMPIVIKPDGLADDELGLVSVKEEPVLVTRRHRTHAELIYVADVDDDDDAAAINDAVSSAAEAAHTLSSSQFSVNSLLAVEQNHWNVSESQHLVKSPSADSQLAVKVNTCRSHGMSSSEYVSSAALHCHSGTVKSVNGCTDSAMLDDANIIQTVVSGVSENGSALGTLSPYCTSDLRASLRPSSSTNTVTSSAQSHIAVDGSADRPSSHIHVSGITGVVRVLSGDRGVGDALASDTVAVSSATTVVTDRMSGTAGETNAKQDCQLTIESCDTVRDTAENNCQLRQSVTASEHCADASASTVLDHSLRNIGKDTASSDLNLACSNSALSNDGDIPSKQTSDTTASDSDDDNAAGVKMRNLVGPEPHASNEVVEHVRPDNSLCTISSVCSIDLKGFDVVDMTDLTAIDDIVTAVYAFDKNSNIIFNNIDLCSPDSHAQRSKLSGSFPPKTVQKKKKKKVRASRFARRRRQKQRSKALHSIGSKLSEPPHQQSAQDKGTDSSVSETTREDKNVDETCLNSAADTDQLDASHDTGKCSESVEDALPTLEPVTEKPLPKTDFTEQSDRLHETPSTSCVSVNSITAHDTHDVSHCCEEATGVESEEQDSDERDAVDVIQEKCSEQPEPEVTDDASLLADDDTSTLKSSCTKKYARVIYDEEDDGNIRSVQHKTETSLQARDTKKVRKFRSGNAERMNHKLIESGMSAEKQSQKVKKKKKKVKRQEQCKWKHNELNGTVAVDTHVTTDASRAFTVPKINRTAIRKHKLKKSRKLLKCGVKQKKSHLRNGNIPNKNINSDSKDITANKHVQLGSSHRLRKSRTVVVGKEKKVLSHFDNNITELSSVSIMHSRGNADEPKQSARDKVTAIYRNSEFMQLCSTTSLVHSKVSKLAGHGNMTTAKCSLSKGSKSPNFCHTVPSVSSAGVSSLSAIADNRTKMDASSIFLPRKNRQFETCRVSSVHDAQQSVITSRCVTSITVTSSAHSPHQPAVRRTEGESSSVTVCRADSDAPAKTVVTGKLLSTVYSEQRSDVVSAQKPQRKVCEASKASLANSVPVVSAAAKLKPCLPEVTMNVVSSINHSTSAPQTSSISSTAALRDPRLASRQRSLSAEQKMVFNLNEHRKAENPATSTVGDSRSQNCSGSVQWPWEQTGSVGIVATGSTNLRTEVSAGNAAPACSMAGSVLQLDKNTCMSLSQYSLLSVDVGDILTDLSASTAAEYLQNSDSSNQWHSADRAIPTGSLMSPSFLTTDKDARASNSGNNSTLPSDAKSMTVNHLPINSRKNEDSSHVMKESLPSSVMNKLRISGSVDRSNNVASGPIVAYWDTEAQSCDLQSKPTDPRLKTTAVVFNTSSLIDKSDNSGISGSVDQSNDVDSRLTVTCWETESLCSEQQTKSTEELDYLQSEALPAAEPLENRIDDFALDTFSVSKNVEDEVDKMMSWWEVELDDVDKCSDYAVGSGDQQQHLENNDSDSLSLENRIDDFALDAFSVSKNVEDEVDKMMSWWEVDVDECSDYAVGSGDQQQHLENNDSDNQFIIIDSGGDDDDDDDLSNDLVIDLDDADVELTSEPRKKQCLDDDSPFTKTVTGHTTRHDVARNTVKSMATESKPDRGTMSDRDRQSVAEAKDNPLGSQYLSTSSHCSVGGHDKKSINVSNVTRERMKHRDEGHRRKTTSDSRSECKTQRRVETTAMTSKFSNDTTAFKPVRDESVKSEKDNAAANREIFRNNGEIHANTAPKNEVPASFKKDQQNPKTLVNTDSAESRGKASKSHARASATQFDSGSKVSTYLACIAAVSKSELSKLNQHLEAQVKVMEQKITKSNRYECPLNDLSESEKRQIVADRLSRPDVMSEFSIDLRLESLEREIVKTTATMVKIKSQFDPTHPSLSLEKKYDDCECTCNNLLVRRDWFFTRMNQLRRYYKSRFLLSLPDDLRFNSERGKYTSLEGVPLILSDLTITLQQCLRLAALLMLIKRLHSNSQMPLPHDVLQKLGWLHRERKTLLIKICCSSAQRVSFRVDCFSEKLTVYKYVTFTMKKKTFILQLL